MLVGLVLVVGACGDTEDRNDCFDRAVERAVENLRSARIDSEYEQLCAIPGVMRNDLAALVSAQHALSEACGPLDGELERQRQRVVDSMSRVGSEIESRLRRCPPTWFCAVGVGGECFRAESDCAQSSTQCERRERVACFAYEDRLSGLQVASCYESFKACELNRLPRRSDPDVVDLADCASQQ